MQSIAPISLFEHLLEEGRLPRLDPHKLALIQSINSKLNDQFLRHRGYANLDDCELTREERHIVEPYAQHGQYGMYFTVKSLDRFLRKEASLVGGMGTEFAKEKKGWGGMSPAEREYLLRHGDPITGKSIEYGVPQHIKDVGPYGPATHSPEYRGGKIAPWNG